MDTETTKSRYQLLRYFRHRNVGTTTFRLCKDLRHYAIDLHGRLYTTLHYNKITTPKLVNPTVVNANRKFHVWIPGEAGTRRRQLVSTGKLVLSTWVGLPAGRRVVRPPHPEGGVWGPLEIDSPQILHYQEPLLTDDLTIYLSTQLGSFVFDYWWPGPNGQYQLRDNYQKILHPQLTEGVSSAS